MSPVKSNWPGPKCPVCEGVGYRRIEWGAPKDCEVCGGYGVLR